MSRKSGLIYFGFLDALVAELVDAHDSDSCPSNGVQVQLLPWAPSFRGKYAFKKERIRLECIAQYLQLRVGS